MNVVERYSKRSLMVVHELEVSDTKKSYPRNSEITSESDSSIEVRSSKTVHRNRCKKLVSDVSSNVVPFTDSAKNDREPVPSKCNLDKKNDKGTVSNLLHRLTMGNYRGVVSFRCRLVDRGYGR